jgi:hypothetical protein
MSCSITTRPREVGPDRSEKKTSNAQRSTLNDAAISNLLISTLNVKCWTLNVS